ncbi:MAG: RNHCP domain-containing protein [Candidatus Doudnabacteria bacterium]|nr:RNHCP domain-containing protein [Candidatus Doudnabacteria bacterium]
MTKKFTRTIEDFTCGHCGFFVSGDGYTNHCPQCFWSKHVDVHPGDRQNACRGLMKPVAIESKSQQFAVIHKCQKCKLERKNKLGTLDDLVQLLKTIEP